MKYQYRVGEIDASSEVLCGSDVLEITPRPRGYINSPPAINSEPPLSAVIGSQYSYALETSDPDGDTLTYSLSQSPAGMSINASSGLIEWTPTSCQESRCRIWVTSTYCLLWGAASAPREGNHQVTVEVANPAGLSDSQSFRIYVADLPPQILTTSLPAAQAGEAYQTQIEATDPSSDGVLSFELTSAPAGMTIDTSNGILNWLPTEADIGSVSLTVRVTGSKGLLLKFRSSFLA